MQIDFYKSFKKQYSKLPKKIQRQFDERFLLFCENQFHSLLNYYELSGKLAGIYSINITSDVRTQFYYKSQDYIIFLNIGTHSKLY